MKIMLTGASGYVGSRLTQKLIDQGHQLHLLLRQKPSQIIFSPPQVKIFDGDIFNMEAIYRAMKGCDAVFHLAALARMWVPNADDFYRVNFEGTKNMVSVAKQTDIVKFVLTSSTGTIGPSLNQANHEDTPRWQSFNNLYEASKYEADQFLLKEAELGFPGLIVLPSRIFGPSNDTPAAGVNRLIKGYLKNRVLFSPGNLSITGNYCYLEDVVDGHILALEKGYTGHKYILGGENISLAYLFDSIQKISPVKGFFVKIPSSLIYSYAWFESWRAHRFDYEPKITPDFVKRMGQNNVFVSKKAQDQLGYQITPFENALKTTIDFYTKQFNL